MNKDKRNKAIFFGVLGLIAIFMLGKIFKPGATDEIVNNVTVEIQEGSTYKSKLQAYKDKRKKERKEAFENAEDWDFDRFCENDGKSPEPEVKETIKEIPKPVKKRQKSVSKSRKGVSKHKESVKKKPTGPTPQEIAEQKAAERERRRQALQSAWGAKKETKVDISKDSYIAVIHKNQSLTNGQMLTMRTKEDIKSGLYTIPKNTLISGKVQFNKNRANLKIKSIRVGRRIFPVILEVYGSDGAKGLPIDVNDLIEEAGDEAANELLESMSSATKGITGVVSTVTKSFKSNKEKSVNFLDNQTVYLHLVIK